MAGAKRPPKGTPSGDPRWKRYMNAIRGGVKKAAKKAGHRAKGTIRRQPIVRAKPKRPKVVHVHHAAPKPRPNTHTGGSMKGKTGSRLAGQARAALKAAARHGQTAAVETVKEQVIGGAAVVVGEMVGNGIVNKVLKLQSGTLLNAGARAVLGVGVALVGDHMGGAADAFATDMGKGLMASCFRAIIRQSNVASLTGLLGDDLGADTTAYDLGADPNYTAAYLAASRALGSLSAGEFQGDDLGSDLDPNGVGDDLVTVGDDGYTNWGMGDEQYTG